MRGTSPAPLFFSPVTPIASYNRESCMIYSFFAMQCCCHRPQCHRMGRMRGMADTTLSLLRQEPQDLVGVSVTKRRIPPVPTVFSRASAAAANGGVPRQASVPPPISRRETDLPRSWRAGPGEFSTTSWTRKLSCHLLVAGQISRTAIGRNRRASVSF